LVALLIVLRYYWDSEFSDFTAKAHYLDPEYPRHYTAKTFLLFFFSIPFYTLHQMKIPGIHTERLSSIFSRKSNLYQTTEAFAMKAIANETKDLNRVAIITGKKKMGKSAVIRNRADRRIKAALQTVYPGLKLKGFFFNKPKKKKGKCLYVSNNFFFIFSGYDFLFFSEPPVITLPWSNLVEQMTRAMKNIEKKASKKK
jgi:ribonuclease P protein component